MEGPLDETALGLERLAELVRQLERRVRALEDRAARPVLDFGGAPSHSTAPSPSVEAPVSLDSGLIQIFGRAVLGLGGAYLLRAASESGEVPKLAGLAAALIYVAAWLTAAARTRPDREIAGTVYAATAALMLSPLLWEAAVRFKTLAPWPAALLLLAFGASGSVLAWVRGRPGILYATFIPVSVTALVLTVATGELLPFTAALLALCAIAESGASRNRWLGLRPWAALAADFSVWLTLRVAAQPPGEAYRPVPWQAALGLELALLGIYLANVSFRTVGRRLPVTIFEVAQLLVVYGLTLSAVMRVAQAAFVPAACCLLLALLSYYVGFRRFSPGRCPRDHYFYLYQGLALVLTGGALLASGLAGAWIGSAAAVAALFASRQTSPLPLAIQAAIFLFAAALISGLLEFGYRMLTGVTLAASPSGAWIVAAASIAGYFVCSGCPRLRWPRLVIAALAAYAAVAFMLLGVAQAMGGTLSSAWLAAVRTTLASSVILLLGLAGSHWKRDELTWIGYSSTALLTLKLFWEDFRQGSPAALAISLLSYGAILALGPRLFRRGARPR